MKKFISRKEAADYLKTTPQTVSNWISKGIISARKVENNVLIDSDTLIAIADDLKTAQECQKRATELNREAFNQEKELHELTSDLREAIGLMREAKKDQRLCNQVIVTIFKSFRLAEREVIPSRDEKLVCRLIRGRSVDGLAMDFNITTTRVCQIVYTVCQRALKYSEEFINMHNAWDNALTENAALKETIKELQRQLPREEVDVDKEVLLNTNVTDLDVSVRALNIMRWMKIETLRDLTKKKPYQLLSCKNCGKKTIEELTDLLHSMGLDWADHTSL